MVLKLFERHTGRETIKAKCDSSMIRQIYRVRGTVTWGTESINYEMDFWEEIISGRSFKNVKTINLNTPTITLKCNADLTVH